jgi:hypothetical protein
VEGDGFAPLSRGRRVAGHGGWGGSNIIRSRLWEIGLQELADDLGLAISLSNSVYHSPLTSLTTVVKVAALQIAQDALE